jgi:23S rRNA (uracil1939-C5)-methyltransferase
MVIVVFFLDEKKGYMILWIFWVRNFRNKLLMYIINTKRNDSLADQEPVLYKGEDHLVEEMED